MKINSIIDLVKDLDTSRQTKNLNKLLIRILLHLQVEFSRKISKGEYEYYQEKIKLNEEMGGLFVPQPSELPSNIRCESSNKQAIGYVGVSLNVAEYRIFISTDDIQYRLPEGYCQGAKGLKEEYTFLDLYLMGYTIAYPDPDPRTGFKGYAWVSGGCTDVRYLGASLEKPSFWPVEINLF